MNELEPAKDRDVEDEYAEDFFLPKERPEGYPPYANYKRDREAARLRAMGLPMDEIADRLRLTHAMTGEPDPRRAAAAVRRGLALVHQVTVEEKRLEQLQHYELLKRRIHKEMEERDIPVLVQQGKVVLHEGVPIEDRRFVLECVDRLDRIEVSIAKLMGTNAAQRFSVEADQLGSEIAQLIALINNDNNDTTYTVERADTGDAA